MIEADIDSFSKSDAQDRSCGPVLLHQLEMIDQEVERDLSKGGNPDFSALAEAVFDMKKQLLEGIEAQKAAEICYSNEEEILGKANEITDKVLIRLIREEYKAGSISTQRLGQILRRMIPDPYELMRVLPKIKAALLEEGMPPSEYLVLVQGLGRELQSDELVRILEKSSEEVGIDGKELIEELKNNPSRAAELICLAAEIRKGTGDEKVLTDLLVGYVERLGANLTSDIHAKEHEEDQQHLRKVIKGLESNIVKHLKDMDVKNDVLKRLEERLDERMDVFFEKLRNGSIQLHSTLSKEDSPKNPTVLEILEQGVEGNEELGQILKIVRSKAESKDIDENDFRQIYAEIAKHKQKGQDKKRKMPPEVLKSDVFMYIMKKEISKVRRYGVPLSTLSFSLVKAKPKTQAPLETITQQALMDAVLDRLCTILRDGDSIGQLGKNKMVVLLPMTSLKGARLVLRRSLKMIHANPLEVNGISVAAKVAGVATGFDADQTPDASGFMRAVSNDLSDMVMRIKNIQALF